MKRDIETRADIDRLISEFYDVVPFDGEIGHHFDGLDIENHLPKIADFWERILFDSPVYFNNPLSFHQVLHAHPPSAQSILFDGSQYFRKRLTACFKAKPPIWQNLEQTLSQTFSIKNSMAVFRSDLRYSLRRLAQNQRSAALSTHFPTPFL